MNCVMCGAWMGVGSIIGALIIVLLVVLIWRLTTRNSQ
jgi:hypothetical protein